MGITGSSQISSRGRGAAIVGWEDPDSGLAVSAPRVESWWKVDCGRPRTLNRVVSRKMSMGWLPREPQIVAASTRVRLLFDHLPARSPPCRRHSGRSTRWKVLHARCTGLDLSKRDAKVCVRIVLAGGSRASEELTTWSSMTPGILALRAHSLEAQVNCVVMEATGDYRKPRLNSQRPRGQEPARPKDRRLRCDMAGPALRSRIVTGLVRTSAADSRIARPHPRQDRDHQGTCPGSALATL